MDLEIRSITERFVILYELLQPEEKRLVRYLVFASVLTFSLEAAAITSLLPVIEVLLEGDTKHFSISVLGGYYYVPILIAVFGIALLFLVRFISLVGLSYFQAKIIFSIQAALSLKIFSGYTYKDFSFFAKNNPSNLIKNVITESQQLTQHGYLPLVHIVSDSIITVGFVGLLIMMGNVQLALLMLVAVIVVFPFSRITTHYISTLGHKRKGADKKRFQFVNEVFEQVDYIKTIGVERLYLEKYASVNDEGATAGWLQLGLHSSVRWIIEFLAILILLFVATVGAVGDLSIAQAGISLIILIRFLPLLSKVTSNLQKLDYCGPVLNEIRVIDSSLSGQKKYPVDRERLNWVRIVFDKVKLDVMVGGGNIFSKTLDFEIKRNTSICLTGNNGVGKTTFARVLLGLYDFHLGGGEITIFQEGSATGKRVTDGKFNFAHWSFVPQHPRFLDESIEDNLKMGDESIKDSEVWDALEIVGLKVDIKKFSDKLKTKVGGQFGQLSGGQRQRLAIARAILAKADGIIMDEPTSATDINFASQFACLCKRLSENLTVILITHDPALIVECDYEIKFGDDIAV